MTFEALVDKILEEQFAGEFGMQDTSVDPGQALEVAKILDPTGILSWKDAYDAYQAFVKEQTPFNGLMLGMALGSVIPAAKYYVTPVKTAVRAGRSTEAIAKYNQAVSKIKTIYADVEPTLQRYNIDTRTVDRALDLSQQNPNNTFRQLEYNQKMQAQGYHQLSPDTHFKRPGTKITSQNFIQVTPTEGGWGLGRRSNNDVVNIVDDYTKRIIKAIGNLKFDPSQIEILRYQKNWYGRDFVELRVPNVPFNVLLYKSYKGTEGKTIGRWYLTRGLTELPNPKTMKYEPVVSKTPYSVKMTEGGSKYMTDLANYLATIL